MDVERDQKAAAIHQTTGHNGLAGRGPLWGQSCCAVSVLTNRVHTYCSLCKTTQSCFLLWYAEFLHRMLEI